VEARRRVCEEQTLEGSKAMRGSAPSCQGNTAANGYGSRGPLKPLKLNGGSVTPALELIARSAR
jgi:hypothetical protein